MPILKNLYKNFYSFFVFFVLLGGCASVRTFPGQDGVYALSVTKQKQRIALLQKKLVFAEKELQAAQDALEQVRSDLNQSQLALIGRQIDVYEQQARKAKAIVHAEPITEHGERRVLFAKEREALQRMMEEGPSTEALEAQFVLDRILRVITALQEGAGNL